MNIKILVATHKKYWMPQDSIYLPIHVGKKDKNSFGFCGDDTGENISEKNPNYCELTAIYWAWKNLKADYIGLSHYRRHFTAKNIFKLILNNKRKCTVTYSELKYILKKYDIVLPKKRNYFIETNKSHYEHAHNPKDLAKTRDVIKKIYPQYLKAFDTVMDRTYAHMFNMFIMKKKYYDRYCKWLFDILEELENYIDVSNYSAYEARVYGYISELLLDVWLEVNKVKYKELKVMFMERQNWFVKIGNFLFRKFKPNFSLNLNYVMLERKR